MRRFFTRQHFLAITTFIFVLTLNVSIAHALSLVNPDKLKDAGETETKTQQFAKEAGFEITDKGASVNDIIAISIKTLLSLIGVAFLALTIYGGVVLFQARGDENEVKKAQKIIEQGVIGLVIVLGAFAISQFILAKFAGQLLLQSAL